MLPHRAGRALGDARGLREESGRGARIRTGGLLRPRQARYQAALRPDSDCLIHSKALPNFTPSPSCRSYPRLCTNGS